MEFSKIEIKKSDANSLAQIKANDVEFRKNSTNTVSIFNELNSKNNEISDTSNLENELKEVEDKQGFLGKLWNGFKNLTGLGTSSNDVEEKIKQYKNGEISYEDAENSIKEFEQKQSGMVDMATSIASGLIVAGSAVITGGTSLVASAAIGGVAKAGLKTLDRATNNKENDELDLKQIGKDVITGSVDGVITTATAGIGAAVKTGAGVTVKEAVKSGAIQGAKQGVISGAVMGATNYTAEAIFEEDVDFSIDEMLKTSAQGAAVGGIMGGALGGITNGIKQAKINKTDAASVVKSKTKLSETNGNKNETNSPSSVEEKAPANSNAGSNETEINSSNSQTKTANNTKSSAEKEGMLGITKKQKNGIIDNNSASENQPAVVNKTKEPEIKFTPEERAGIIKESGFAPNLSKKLNNLNDDELAAAIKLKNAGFSDRFSINGSKYNVDTAVKLKDAGFDECTSIIGAKELDIKNINTAFELKKAGFGGHDCIKGAKELDIKNIDAAVKLKNAGFDSQYCIKGAKELDIKNIDAAVKLKNAGFGELTSLRRAAEINPDNIHLAQYLKSIGIEDDSSVLLAEGNFEYRTYKSIQDDIRQGYDITVIKNQQTGEIEPSLYRCEKDDTFNKLVRIEKKYGQNQEIKFSRTTYDMPTVEIKEGNYHINGMNSYISEADINMQADISVNEYGLWTINGNETVLPATASSKIKSAESPTTIMVDYTDGITTKNIDKMFETTISPDGKVEIIQTKKSDILDGAYEVTRYTESDFKGFSQDTDIISEIKKGNVKGEKLSSVTQNKDGSITLNENFERNGSNIRRNYTQRTNGSEYSYHITDENGNSILKLDRSFSKNPDGTTTTVINGKKYVTTFDNANKTAIVADDSGRKTIINFADKMKESQQKDADAFFEFAKSVPADQLKTMEKNIKTIKLLDKLESGTAEGELHVGKNDFILSHELGHTKDFTFDMKPLLSNNPELKMTYTDEMLSFNKKYPSDIQDVIAYFGFNGGGTDLYGSFVNDGLSELLAESNALCTTYGIKVPELTTRSQFIVKHFPKTVSKIASLLGYNAT